MDDGTEIDELRRRVDELESIVMEMGRVRIATDSDEDLRRRVFELERRADERDESDVAFVGLSEGESAPCTDVAPDDADAEYPFHVTFEPSYSEEGSGGTEGGRWVIYLPEGCVKVGNAVAAFKDGECATGLSEVHEDYATVEPSDTIYCNIFKGGSEDGETSYEYSIDATDYDDAFVSFKVAGFDGDLGEVCMQYANGVSCIGYGADDFLACFKAHVGADGNWNVCSPIVVTPSGSIVATLPAGTAIGNGTWYCAVYNEDGNWSAEITKSVARLGHLVEAVELFYIHDDIVEQRHVGAVVIGLLGERAKVRKIDDTAGVIDLNANDLLKGETISVHTLTVPDKDSEGGSKVVKILSTEDAAVQGGGGGGESSDIDVITGISFSLSSSGVVATVTKRKVSGVLTIGGEASGSVDVVKVSSVRLASGVSYNSDGTYHIENKLRNVNVIGDAGSESTENAISTTQFVP